MAEEDEQNIGDGAIKVGIADEEKSTARSRSSSPSRSASYSPSPPRSAPPSPLRQSLSQSPQRSRQSRSRSPVLRDYSARDEGRRERSIEVTGLTKIVRESHLEHIFGQYGTITNVILPVRRSGESKGRGYVMYRSSASALKAEEYMDDGQIDGAIISVRQAAVPDRELDEQRRSREHEDSVRYYNPDTYQQRRDDYVRYPSSRSGRFYNDREAGRNGSRQNPRDDRYRRKNHSRDSRRFSVSRSPPRS